MVKPGGRWRVGLLATAGCGRLDSIPYRPPQTPDSWLRLQPFTDLTIGSHHLVLVQPSSTVFVYLLGLLAAGIGLTCLRGREQHPAMRWWGIALLLWGLGALLAGTSYQAFSYEIKCAGRAFCSWTSWWEVTYLVLSVASVSAVMVAVAHACTTGRWRRALSRYALVMLALYAGVVLVGALVPVPFLISFELMILVAAPGMLALVVLNGWRYYQFRVGLDLALLVTWAGLGATLGAYYLYLILDLSGSLWAHGIWFTENDVLHIGLIVWMIHIATRVVPRMGDAPTPVRAGPGADTA